jgi:hypothetical protein
VRELAFDFLRAKLCLPFLAGHWDGRNTVVDKVHIAFNWLGRFSKASVKQPLSQKPIAFALSRQNKTGYVCWQALRQRLLTKISHNRLRPAFLAEICKQKEKASEALFARIK